MEEFLDTTGVRGARKARMTLLYWRGVASTTEVRGGKEG